MNGKIRTVVASMFAAAFAVVTVGVASAQSGSDEPQSSRHGYVGVVTESSTSTRTLSVKINAGVGSTSTPAAITFLLTDDTRVKTPGARGGVAGGIEVGARVAVLGESGPDGSWTAIQVLVKPTAPTFQPATGSVVGVENGVMTLVLPNGKTKMVEIGNGQKVPEQGEIVTVFAPDATESQRPSRSTGLVRATEVHERLKKFLDETEANGPELPSSIKSHREAVASKLARLLERHAEHRVEILEGVMSRGGFPAQARAGIERALENGKQNRSEAISIADGARGRLGIPKGGVEGKPGQPATPPAQRGQGGGR